MIFNYRVSKLMREILLEDKTGTLVCESADAKRRVYFEEGLLIGSRSSREDELLGSVLVAKRAISHEQLAQATELIRTGKRMGQILMELGFLTGNDVVRFVRIQIVDIACNMLFAAPNRLSFSEGIDVEPVTSISIVDVFMEAANRLPETQYYRGNLLTNETSLRLAKDELLSMRAASLSPDEAAIFELVREGKRTGEILESSPLSEDEAIRILIGLLQAGLIERLQDTTQKAAPTVPAAASSPVPPPTGTNEPSEPSQPNEDDPFVREVHRVSSQLTNQNHWQVLDLSPGASAQAIRRAFQERSARFHPDRHPQLTDEKTRAALASIVSRASEAFNALTAAANKAKAEAETETEEGTSGTSQRAPAGVTGGEGEPDGSTPKDPVRAKELFNRAKRAFQISDFWEAIEMCRLAIEHGANEAEHYHLLGLALGHNSRWRKDAEKNLQIATNLKPWEPKYFVSLAELYQREGLHSRAKRTIEQIMAIDPTFKLPESLTGGGDGKTKPTARTVGTA